MPVPTRPTLRDTGPANDTGRSHASSKPPVSSPPKKSKRQAMSPPMIERQRAGLLVEADADLEFRYVAEAIDIAKGAGIDKVGLMTPKVEAGE